MKTEQKVLYISNRIGDMPNSFFNPETKFETLISKDSKVFNFLGEFISPSRLLSLKQYRDEMDKEGRKIYLVIDLDITLPAFRQVYSLFNSPEYISPKRDSTVFLYNTENFGVIYLSLDKLKDDAKTRLIYIEKGQRYNLVYLIEPNEGNLPSFKKFFIELSERAYFFSKDEYRKIFFRYSKNLKKIGSLSYKEEDIDILSVSFETKEEILILSDLFKSNRFVGSLDNFLMTGLDKDNVVLVEGLHKNLFFLEKDFEIPEDKLNLRNFSFFGFKLKNFETYDIGYHKLIYWENPDRKIKHQILQRFDSQTDYIRSLFQSFFFPLELIEKISADIKALGKHPDDVYIEYFGPVGGMGSYLKIELGNIHQGVDYIIYKKDFDDSVSYKRTEHTLKKILPKKPF